MIQWTVRGSGQGERDRDRRRQNQIQGTAAGCHHVLDVGNGHVLRDKLQSIALPSTQATEQERAVGGRARGPRRLVGRGAVARGDGDAWDWIGWSGRYARLGDRTPIGIEYPAREDRLAEQRHDVRRYAGRLTPHPLVAGKAVGPHREREVIPSGFGRGVDDMRRRARAIRPLRLAVAEVHHGVLNRSAVALDDHDEIAPAIRFDVA